MGDIRHSNIKKINDLVELSRLESISNNTICIDNISKSLDTIESYDNKDYLNMVDVVLNALK